jgi:hypothetical protein
MNQTLSVFTEGEQQGITTCPKYTGCQRCQFCQLIEKRWYGSFGDMVGS